MANITFSSPAMKKDLTVYATAGDCRTLLSIAREHKVPIAFECEDGECGSCPVKVSILANKQPMGMHLTEKEKTVLRLAGKISRQQIEEAELKDIPPPWRLACQFIVRDEDILVQL
ncbi:2Fe-2S iron-sulfur cluster binding domain protein [mine drainage metagenome]|uniref:2Fe-2S iron-sulfur cluster binding domain protein n=1 Tax=mine drainage metagenome TaxID=410659 RepID=A0A1J5Q0I4_9ZZZZ